MTALALDLLESAGEAEALTMKPVGPVAHAFTQDRAFLRTIMGPYGSAKTTTCFQAIVWATMWQNPDRNGVRRSRGCITRDTYGQLHDTVMKDWFSWFPKTRDNWNGERNEHRVALDVPGFGRLEIEVLFRACEDRAKAEQVFKGMQLTWLYPNEVDTQDPGVVEFGLPRLGRYPPASRGGCAWYGMIADMNAPDIDNWTYDLLVNGDMKMPPETVEIMRAELGPNYRIAFHRQPSGLDADAENMENLPKGYYQRMMIGKNENYIRRFIKNEFGAVRSGQPVYPEFNDRFHCASGPVMVEPGTPVAMGVDGGSTPAIAFGQFMPSGQIRIVAELVVFAANEDAELEKMGPDAFGEEAATFWLEHFGRNAFGGAWADPAGLYGDEYADSWAKLFWKAFRRKIGGAARDWKLKAAPCKGNRLPDRIEPVRRLLVQNVGGQPGLLVSSTARHLRRGFNNGYVFVRVQFSNGQGRWKDEPLKNDYSHVHDALQYLVLGLTRRGAMAERAEPRGRVQRAQSRRKIDFGTGPLAHRQAN